MKKVKIPKVSDPIYVDSHYYISHGSDDVSGGKATVNKVYTSISGGKNVIFVEVHEHPGNGYNWTEFLSKKQNELKKEFKNIRAEACPDIDTPWIEEGDLVNGKIHKGSPIW